MSYGDQVTVRVRLGWVACVKPWPLPVLERVFVKGGARENRPPRGVEKSMLIFEKMVMEKEKVAGRNGFVERNILFGRQNGEAFKATRVRCFFVLRT